MNKELTNAINKYEEHGHSVKNKIISILINDNDLKQLRKKYPELLTVEVGTNNRNCNVNSHWWSDPNFSFIDKNNNVIKYNVSEEFDSRRIRNLANKIGQWWFNIQIILERTTLFDDEFGVVFILK